MKAATLTALRGSIRKWEAIVAGTGGDDGVDNCPLCQRFQVDGDTVCKLGEEVCPVAVDAEMSFCGNTPYQDWACAVDCKVGLARFPRMAADDETVMCAVLELEFLKSLLPSRQR